MSQYTIQELHEGTRISGKPAWHQTQADLARLEALGWYFPNGPVPYEVAMELVGWQPITFLVPNVVDPDTMEVYAMPSRLQQFVARPGHGIINNASTTFNAPLHNVMRENLDMALHGGYTIEAAVCLGDGDFIGLTLIPADTLTVQGIYGELTPKIAMVTSLTGKIATGLLDTVTRGVCDNTMAAQLRNASRKLMVKRTKNSNGMVSPARIAETLEIAVRHAEDVAAEFERLGQITVSDGDIAQLLDLWQPLVKADGTDKEGRGLTMATITRGTFVNLLTRDPRAGQLGQTAAGLWNAHNTWAHWSQTSRGGGNRISRQMERTATGQVAKDDAVFMALVAQVLPEVSKALATV